MKKALLMAVLFVLVQDHLASQDVFVSDKLQKKWETGQVFLIPESVCYDAERHVLYVSNINGKPTEKDGNGFISRCSEDGEVMELKWVDGLDAPKGMGVYKNKLYVTDIDRIAEIDIENMAIQRFYTVEGAKFLNDIAIDSKGDVYISDMMDTKIYRINDQGIHLWIDDEMLTNPNGLFAENKTLFIGCRKIVRADMKKGTLSPWAGETGSIDGLEGTGDGRYLFSDWQGNVYLLGTDLKTEKILDLTPAGMNAADIEFIPEKMLLLVPTFSDNRVIAFELIK